MSFQGGGLDPQLLIAKVLEMTGLLQDAQRRWTAAMNDAVHVQYHTMEAVAQTRSWAAAVGHQAAEDEMLARQAADDAAHWAARLATIAGYADASGDSVRASRCRASDCLNDWRDEEDRAEGWVSRARDREAKALRVFEETRMAHERALDELRSAEAELRAARNRKEHAGRDSQGNAIYKPVDTAPYERAVRQARREVEYWRERLDEARRELEAARREHAAARQRLNSCREAVATAEKAVVVLDRAGEAMEQARLCRERMAEEYLRMKRLSAGAEIRAGEELSRANEMMSRVGRAGASHDQASHFLLSAGQSHAEAQHKSLAGTLEVDHRMERLRLFDAPLH
jgi:hypothetical protein